MISSVKYEQAPCNMVYEIHPMHRNIDCDRSEKHINRILRYDFGHCCSANCGIVSCHGRVSLQFKIARDAPDSRDSPRFIISGYSNAVNS